MTCRLSTRLVGFGTERGTVMAVSRWGEAPEIEDVRPSLPGSHGVLFREAGPERFLLEKLPVDQDKFYLDYFFSLTL